MLQARAGMIARLQGELLLDLHYAARAALAEPGVQDWSWSPALMRSLMCCTGLPHGLTQSALRRRGTNDHDGGETSRAPDSAPSC